MSKRVCCKVVSDTHSVGKDGGLVRLDQGKPYLFGSIADAEKARKAQGIGFRIEKARVKRQLRSALGLTTRR
jgi:hypothetical protein